MIGEQNLKNEINNLKLEIIRLKSICYTAAQELECLVEESEHKCPELISSLKQHIYKDYTTDFPHLTLEKEEIINQIKCK